MSNTSLKIDEINILFDAYLKQEDRRIKSISADNQYLCFTALQANSTVQFGGTANLEYSTDQALWIAYPDAKPAITLSSIGDCLYLRCKDNIISCSSGHFATSGNLKLSGNVLSLVNWCPILKEYNFSHLFDGNTAISDVSELLFQANELNDYSCQYMFANTGITSLPILKIKKAPNMNASQYMFYKCNNLEFVNVPLYMTIANGNSISYWFKECQNLKYANLDFSGFTDTDFNGSWYFARELFAKCTNIKAIRLAGVHNFYSNRHLFEDWLSQAAQDGVLICPPDLDTTTRDKYTIPAGWSVIKGGNEWDKATTSNTDVTTTDSYLVNPGRTVPCITVTSTLVLNAQNLVASTDIAYAEVVLDIDASATVTAGTNLTFADTLTAGKRNICEVRWSDGAAKLRIKYLEDLPESSSASA